MKEAAGEANMTVITIVLISIVLGVGTLIVTNLMNSVAKKSACAEIGGRLSGNTCTVTRANGSFDLHTCVNGANGWSCDGPYVDSGSSNSSNGNGSSSQSGSTNNGNSGSPGGSSGGSSGGSGGEPGTTVW